MRLHRQPFVSGDVTTSGRGRSAPSAARVWASQKFLCSPPTAPQQRLAQSGSRSSAAERLRTAAAPPAASAPSPAGQPTTVSLPASQQDAVEAAVQCLLPAVQPLLMSVKPTKTAKGFSNSSKPGLASNRFGIEIPVLDPSAQAALDLTSLLINTTAARIKQRGGGGAAAAPANWTVVHAREDVVNLARSRGGAGGQVLGLRQACQQPQLGGLLVVVEPSVSDVALLEQLLDDVWGGPAAVVLNPQWAQQGVQVPAEYDRLLASIAVVYSFLPCSIQGLLGRKDGAVLCATDPGSTSAKASWRILLNQNDQFVQVGAMARRPTSGDLELAFLNASAASSPLTKTAKFLRGLIPGGKK